MRQHFTIATLRRLRLRRPCRSRRGRRGTCPRRRHRRQRAVDLHGAKRRHAVGHLRQVPEGPVALARSLADEPRPDPQSAPDLSGRRHRSRAQSTAARNWRWRATRYRLSPDSPRFSARRPGDSRHSAGRHRAIPDAAAHHRAGRVSRTRRRSSPGATIASSAAKATSSTPPASIRRGATCGSSTGRASASSTAPAKCWATRTASSAPLASSASPKCRRRASSRPPRRSSSATACCRLPARSCRTTCRMRPIARSTGEF